jgi:uncharacterized protein (DUF58 family)
VKWTWSDISAGSAALREPLRERWQRWLDRRIPPASSVTLDQRRIFIFPSGTGFFFFLCLLVMLLTAINYQNNMSYALTFLLANLFVVAVLHSYSNLSGLTITALGAEDSFPHQRTAFRVRLRCDNRRGHHALMIGWPMREEGERRRRFMTGLFSTPAMETQLLVDLAGDEQRDIALYLPVTRRGWYRPGRLRIESVYPLGLLRCWTWVDLDFRALVYPAPLARAEPQAARGDNDDGAQLGASGDDEFYGLRDYRDGDSPRRIYWKGVARGQDLQSKDFAMAISDHRWLDWRDFPGLGVEERLSALAYWALEYHRLELEYGLRLPGAEVAPARGDGQRDRALRALALHGLDDE